MRVGKVLLSVALLLCGIVAAQAQTIDEVYKKALTEGGTLNFYGTLGANQRGNYSSRVREAFSRASK